MNLCLFRCQDREYAIVKWLYSMEKFRRRTTTSTQYLSSNKVERSQQRFKRLYTYHLPRFGQNCLFSQWYWAHHVLAACVSIQWVERRYKLNKIKWFSLTNFLLLIQCSMLVLETSYVIKVEVVRELHWVFNVHVPFSSRGYTATDVSQILFFCKISILSRWISYKGHGIIYRLHLGLWLS